VWQEEVESAHVHVDLEANTRGAEGGEQQAELAACEDAANKPHRCV
jgi:hypothetical protein